MFHAIVVECRLRVCPTRCLFFFCGQAAGNDGLQEVTTFQLDQRVHECAEVTGDSMLLAKLISGDMVVALEAQYHSITTVPGKVQVQQGAGSEEDKISGIVFAELHLY